MGCLAIPLNKEALMSRIFAVLLMTAGILHAQGPSDSSLPNSVYRVIFVKAFSDEQLVFDENKVLRIIKEMDALKSAWSRYESAY